MHKAIGTVNSKFMRLHRDTKLMSNSNKLVCSGFSIGDCVNLYRNIQSFYVCTFVQFTGSVLLVLIPPREPVTLLGFAGQKGCVCMVVTGLARQSYTFTVFSGHSLII